MHAKESQKNGFQGPALHSLFLSFYLPLANVCGYWGVYDCFLADQSTTLLLILDLTHPKLNQILREEDPHRRRIHLPRFSRTHKHILTGPMQTIFHNMFSG